MNTRVMGVLNITPDSFSDGASYLDLESALSHARRMIADGATIIDVGGESTRPGAARVSPEEEQRRVLPVVKQLAAEGVEVSIDTVNAETARLAVEAGASIINDVSGGTADAAMCRVAAETGATFVIMHWRGIPDPAHARSAYANVVEEVCSELEALAEAAIAAGVERNKIVLDPGLGFDKTAEQGWQLLAGFDRLASLGYPVLIGISRKRMLGETLAAALAEPTMGDRDVATAVVSAYSAQKAAWGVRVHDVRATVAAIAVADAIVVADQIAASQCVTNGRFEPSQATNCDTLGGMPSLPSSSDRIVLTGLEVFAHHGVFDFERESGQRFVIDAEVVVDLRAAAAGDDLAHTVNYAELAGAILAAAQDSPVDLIETLAERIAKVALSFDAVQLATITVHKPEAPIDATFSDVSVTVTRGRAVSMNAGAQ